MPWRRPAGKWPAGIAVGMALALLAGCMHVPPRTVDAEEAQVPERWHAPLTVEPAASAAVSKEAASAASTPAKGAQAPGLDALYDWWGRWNDPALLTLIGAAEEASPTLATAAARIAQAEVQAARASVQVAQTNLRYARIEAPIAGRISLSNVTPGALVTANQSTALTEVVQIDPMYVDFTQSTAQLLQLQRDWAAGRYEKLDASSMPIALQLEDGSAYPHVGKLQFSGLMVNPSMGTVTLRAVVPNPDGQLLPGMFAQAVLPTGIASGALLIPQQAVTRDATGRASVLVVQDRDGQKIAVQRTVQLAQAVGNQWLVESGVQAGDMVVVEGFQRFKPGDRVDPQTMPAQRPAAAAVDPQAAAAALRSALERQP